MPCRGCFSLSLSQRKNRLEEWIKQLPHFYAPPISPTPTHPCRPPSGIHPCPQSPPPAAVLLSEILCVVVLVCERWMVVVPLRRRSRIWWLVTGVRCYGVSHFLHEGFPSTIHKTGARAPETRPTRSRTHPKCPRLIPLKSASIE